MNIILANAKHILMLSVLAMFYMTMSAQTPRMSFMGVKIGVDSLETLEKVLAEKGYGEKRYDDINDLNAYYGECQGMESCVYVSTLEGKVSRVFFRVSDSSWTKLQPVAKAIVRKLKKDYADFDMKENNKPEDDLNYRVYFERDYEYVSFFNIQRDETAYDVTVTYE